MRIIFAFDIKYTDKPGEGVQLYHNGLGVVVHRNATIGRHVKISQIETIGGNGRAEESNAVPPIEDDVFIDEGAVILRPIAVGQGVKIGANAVVFSNVHPGTVTVGVPAIIK